MDSEAEMWLAWGRKAGLKLLDAFATDLEENGEAPTLESGGRIRIGGDCFAIDGLILKRVGEDDAGDP